jgi:translation initiation factor IF-3
MELNAKVLRIGETETIGEKQFKKRDLIVEYAENPTYPQILKFEASQAKVDLLDHLNEGDEIKIYFNLNGREWVNAKGETQVFNTLGYWKHEVLTAASSEPLPF